MHQIVLLEVMRRHDCAHVSINLAGVAGTFADREKRILAVSTFLFSPLSSVEAGLGVFTGCPIALSCRTGRRMGVGRRRACRVSAAAACLRRT